MTREELKALCMLLGGVDFSPRVEPPVFNFHSSGTMKSIRMVALCGGNYAVVVLDDEIEPATLSYCETAAFLRRDYFVGLHAQEI